MSLCSVSLCSYSISFCKNILFNLGDDLSTESLMSSIILIYPFSSSPSVRIRELSIGKGEARVENLKLSFATNFISIAIDICFFLILLLGLPFCWGEVALRTVGCRFEGLLIVR